MGKINYSDVESRFDDSLEEMHIKRVIEASNAVPRGPAGEEEAVKKKQEARTKLTQRLKHLAGRLIREIRWLKKYDPDVCKKVKMGRPKLREIAENAETLGEKDLERLIKVKERLHEVRLEVRKQQDEQKEQERIEREEEKQREKDEELLWLFEDEDDEKEEEEEEEDEEDPDISAERLRQKHLRFNVNPKWKPLD